MLIELFYAKKSGRCKAQEHKYGERNSGLVFPTAALFPLTIRSTRSEECDQSSRWQVYLNNTKKMSFFFFKGVREYSPLIKGASLRALGAKDSQRHPRRSHRLFLNAYLIKLALWSMHCGKVDITDILEGMSWAPAPHSRLTGHLNSHASVFSCTKLS